jgi:RNA polymerase sigma factor (sigma-70 family)
MKTEIETILVQNVTEDNINTVLNWFDKRKNSFYKLARTYLKSIEDIQEVFSQTIIKVHDDIQYVKEDTHFESWVTTIFINECSKIEKRNDSEEIEKDIPASQVFQALDRLADSDKEAIALTYLKGLPFEDAGSILQISAEDLKSRLAHGVESLSRELKYGDLSDSCPEYQDKFIDYLGKTLDRHKKIDLEIHTYHCQPCQEKLSIFQEVILSLENSIDELPVPSEFMDKIHERVAETERLKKEKKKKRSRMGLAAVGLLTFMICTGFVTGSFSNIYYSWMGWTEKEEKEIITYYKEGISEPLNLEEESNGVKVRIKTAVADDVQTLIYYEVEDTKGENQFFINMSDGARIENEYEILDHQANDRFYHPFEQGVSNEDSDKKIFRGKVSLAPISKDSGTIELRLMRLQEAFKEDPNRSNLRYFEQEFIEGEWNFDVPVTKQTSTVYELDQETEINGIPFRVDKLKLAPSATILEYSFNQHQGNRMIENVTMESLAVEGKSVKADLFGGLGYGHSSGEWISMQTSFEPLYFDKPKEVNLSFHSINLFVEEKKTIEINQSDKFPQTFEYLGNELSIDNVAVGNPTRIHLTDPYTKNREYERIRFNVVSEDELQSFGFGSGGDGVLVDQEGTEFKPEEYQFSYDTIEQPRYFSTSHEIELHQDSSDQPLYPKKLLIEGYDKTMYVEDKIRLKLD